MKACPTSLLILLLALMDNIYIYIYIFVYDICVEAWKNTSYGEGLTLIYTYAHSLCI